MPPAEPQRRGLRFSLRSLLFLTAFTAILLSLRKMFDLEEEFRIWCNLIPRWAADESLVWIGLIGSLLLVPLGAVGVPVYAWLSRRSPSFLLLFAAGAGAMTVSAVLALLGWTEVPAEFALYYLLTMFSGSLLALVECRVKGLPAAAVCISLAALVGSLSFLCFLSAVTILEQAG